MRSTFDGTHSSAPSMRFDRVQFKYSFRSAPTVLEAVDTVFRREQALTPA